MEGLQAPEQEKELPAPNEKFLRTPTLWEKYGKWLMLSFILIIIIPISILFLKSKKTTSIQSTQAPTTPLIITQPPTTHLTPVLTATLTTAIEPTNDINIEKNDKMTITILVPENIDDYMQAIRKYVNGDSKINPAITWQLTKQQVTVPYSNDIIQATIRAAVDKLLTSTGLSNSSFVVGGLNIDKENRKAHVHIFHEEALASAAVRPIIEKNLLQFPEIEKVEFLNIIPGR